MLESVRENFESKGYKFVADPRPNQLPPFLAGHTPDAIATSAHDNVIIEIKRRQSNEARASIAKLSRDLPPGSGWRYVLVYAGQDPDEFIELSRPKRSQIDEAIKEIHSLQESGHSRAALNECWSLLEALTRRLYPEDFRISLRPLRRSKPLSDWRWTGSLVTRTQNVSVLWVQFVIRSFMAI